MTAQEALLTIALFVGASTLTAFYIIAAPYGRSARARLRRAR